MHAVVIASRFGMLLGLALWLGLGVALLLSFPVIEKQLAPDQARELFGALDLRMDRWLFGALALVLLGLGTRITLDRTAPPSALVVPVAVMTLSRLLSALAKRPAFSRLQGARGLLLSLEVCLCLYALLAVS